MIEFIKKDITTVTAADGFIIHQCNCVTKGAAKGVAAEIFKKFPYANIYKDRKVDDVPGSVIARSPGRADGPVVVNLLAQFYPGKPKSKTSFDCVGDRENWLMFSIGKALGAVCGKVYFPFGMGCVLAGGDWNRVMEIIEQYSVKRDFVCCEKP